MSDSAGTDAGLATPERGRPTAPAGERRPSRLRRVTTFYKQVVAELRKVIWPTRNELLTYTSVVLVFVLFIIAFVSLLDLALGWAIFKVFS